MGGLLKKDNLIKIIGMMASSSQMACYLVTTPVLADMAEFFPNVDFQYIQLVSTIPWLFAVVVAYITGKLTAFIYKKTLILIGIVIMFAGGLFQFLFYYNFILLLAGSAVTGVGIGLILSTISALIYDYFSGKDGTLLMGIQSAFIGIGGLLYSWLGGLFGKDQWQNAYYAYFLAIIIFIISVICLPKGKLLTDYNFDDCKVVDGKVIKENAKDFKVPKEVWVMAILGFFYFVFLGIFNTNISMIMKLKELGGTVESSYATMCYTIAGIVLGCLAGPIVVKIGKKVFPMIMFMGTAGMLIGYLGGSVVLLCISGAFCGIAFCLYNPTCNFYTAGYTTGRNRDASISTYVSVATLGSALSPLIISSCLGFLSIEERMLGGAVGFAVIGIIYIFVINTMMKDKK